MARVCLAVCCCAALAGCQGAGRPFPPPEPKPQCTVALFEESEPRPEPLRQAVLRHVPPGTPVDRARSMLEEQGFVCRVDDQPHSLWHPFDLVPRGVEVPPSVLSQLRSMRDRPPMYCVAKLRAVQDWHLRSWDVLVVLVPDGARAVEDVQVWMSAAHCRTFDEEFFEGRPDLHAPLGLPVEEARARMSAAGFRCSGVEANGADGDARPHVRCEAFDEGLLIGNIVRVHLYPDEAGVVREVKHLERGERLDHIRCLLPHGDETPAVAVCKTVLCPVRLGVLYGLVAAGVTVGPLLCMAMVGAY